MGVTAKTLFTCPVPVRDLSGVFNVNLGSDVLEAPRPPHRRGNSPKLENENGVSTTCGALKSVP